MGVSNIEFQVEEDYLHFTRPEGHLNSGEDPEF